jgi:hypothetical protein
MSGLRLLQYDQEGIDSVRTLMPDKYLFAWERGYDKDGIWKDELAKIALHNLRTSRVMEAQNAGNQMREQTFIDNQRSPAKKRPGEDGSSPTKRRQTIYKCKTCQTTAHTKATCPKTPKNKQAVPITSAGAYLYPFSIPPFP